MRNIIREISKLCMFTIVWGFPLLLAYWNKNNSFLWFFILSLFIMLMVFDHYEVIEKNDNSKDKNDE